MTVRMGNTATTIMAVWNHMALAIICQRQLVAAQMTDYLRVVTELDRACMRLGVKTRCV